MSAHVQLIGPATLRVERVLPGPIERVWSYLVEGDKRAQWLAGGTTELKPGGRIELVFNNAHLTTPDDGPPEKYRKYAGETRYVGQVLTAEPPRLLAFTWPEQSGEASEVTIELAPQGEEVLLTLTHVRLAKRDDVLGAAAGWHVHLDILGAKLRGAAPPRFWAEHTRLEAEYAKRFPEG